MEGVGQTGLSQELDDEVFGQSARLAFYFFFAIFPVLLLLLILLGRSGGAGSELFGALLDSFKHILPADAPALVANTTRQLDASAVLGAGALAAVAGSAWELTGSRAAGKDHASRAKPQNMASR